jgi:hypothetical protein
VHLPLLHTHPILTRPRFHLPLLHPPLSAQLRHPLQQGADKRPWRSRKEDKQDKQDKEKALQVAAAMLIPHSRKSFVAPRMSSTRMPRTMSKSGTSYDTALKTIWIHAREPNGWRCI